MERVCECRKELLKPSVAKKDIGDEVYANLSKLATTFVTTIAKGKLVARRYRNRRIGEFFKELKMTEGRCTGIPKIIRAMKVNGSPEPIFETDEDRNYFLAILNIHPESHVSEQLGERVEAVEGLNHSEFNKLISSLSQVCPKSVPGQTAASVILKARNSIDMATLMLRLNQKNRTRFRNQLINPLIKTGLTVFSIQRKRH